MRGTFAHQRPQHALELPQSWLQIVLPELCFRRGEQAFANTVDQHAAETAGDPVADRVHPRTAVPPPGCDLKPLQGRVVAGGDDLAQQMPPAREQQGAIVELDRQQVCLGEALFRQQAIADLPTACAQVVATVPGNGQGVPIEHAAVGGPQPMRGGIDQCGRAIAADWPRRTACRRGGGVAVRRAVRSAVRACADQPPGDATAAVGEHQVLRGNAAAVGHLERLVKRRRARHLGEVQAHRTGELCRPAQCLATAVLPRVQHRTPGGLAHAQRHRCLAGDADTLLVRGDARRIGGYAAEIGRVDVTVGEAPGHVSVAAHHDGRQAGQREATDIDAAVGSLCIGIAQPYPEPEIGGAQSQVHIVGDDGATVRGQCTGHGEVVAAQHIGVQLTGRDGTGGLRRIGPPEIEDGGIR